MALVTGGSSGIGAAVAKTREGAKVVIAARRTNKGEAVSREIAAQGGRAIFIRTDVTKRADVEALVNGALAKSGRLDCAFNNAGIAGPTTTPIAEIEEKSWDELMNLNLKSVWLCMKYEIPAMLKQGRGAIVNVCSVYAWKPSDIGHAPYAASEYAVIGLSKTARWIMGSRAFESTWCAPVLFTRRCWTRISIQPLI